MDPIEGVVARALVVLEIDEVERLLAAGGNGPFTDAELAYARSKSDPTRRLAARLAAKQAVREVLDVAVESVEVVAGRGGPPTLRLLGSAAGRLRDVEVMRGRGAPRLDFAARAQALLAARGADRVLVSLTHERRHAAAVVLVLTAGA
jgi:phosphopantetheinyl transferase (holo-ACP synthase)